MEYQPDPGFQQKFLGQHLQPLGIQRRGPADRAVEGRGALAPVGRLGRLARAPVGGIGTSQPFLGHAIQHVFGEAPDHLPTGPVGHPIDPDDEAAGGEPAQVVVPLQHHHVGAGPRRRQGRGAARRAAAHHQHVALVIDRQLSRRLEIDARSVLWGQGALIAFEQVRSQEPVLGLTHGLDLGHHGLVGHGDLRVADS